MTARIGLQMLHQVIPAPHANRTVQRGQSGSLLNMNPSVGLAFGMPFHRVYLSRVVLIRTICTTHKHHTISVLAQHNHTPIALFSRLYVFATARIAIL